MYYSKITITSDIKVLHSVFSFFQSRLWPCTATFVSNNLYILSKNHIVKIMLVLLCMLMMLCDDISWVLPIIFVTHSNSWHMAFYWNWAWLRRAHSRHDTIKIGTNKYIQNLKVAGARSSYQCGIQGKDRIALG